MKSMNLKQDIGVQTNEHLGGNERNTGINLKIGTNIPQVELDELDLEPSFKKILIAGHDPEKPKEEDNSRSAWLFQAICTMLTKKISDEKIYAVITDSRYKISDSVLEKSNPDNYARRQIIRAKEKNIHPWLQRMNDRHAVIGNYAGKCVVIEEVDDEVSLNEDMRVKRKITTFSTMQAIRDRYNNRLIEAGKTKEGKPKFEPLGNYWIQNENRRQYNTIEFNPMETRKGIYNLWKGLGIIPDPTGKCDLFLKHIEENICNGDTAHYTYLINWLARAVQTALQAWRSSGSITGG